MSNVEIQELMAEEAEEAVLEAFAEQNESDESEDDSDISEEQSDQTEEQNDILAEQDDVLADQDDVLADQDDILEDLGGLTQEHGERADGEQILTINTLSPEKQMIGAPTKVGVSQEDTDEKQTEPNILQPPIWAKNTLVLVDPFLVAKV